MIIDDKKRVFLIILATILVEGLVVLCARQHSEQDNVEISIKSETFALKGTEPKQFLYWPRKIQRVYQYEKDDGALVIYEIGTDYVIENDRIRRTESSRIPDYDNHKVQYSGDGTFAFSSDPRNPELNIEYQILVDYTTVIKPFTVKPKGQLQIVEELKGGEDIRIFLCGDSISAGAQTTGLYYFGDHIATTFFGYLRDFLDDYYGVTVDAKLFGKDGCSLSYLMENIDTIIAEKPDMVLIEFGMNDHVVDGAMNEEVQGRFKANLDSCVSQLLENGIEVILIGFFQQNDEWERENVKATIAYNNLIKQVADESNVPFVDVYQAFERIKDKDMYEDLMSDYMHIPTDFGHKIYFSELLPYFLDREWESIENYIYHNYQVI